MDNWALPYRPQGRPEDKRDGSTVTRRRNDLSGSGLRKRPYRLPAGLSLLGAIPSALRASTLKRMALLLAFCLLPNLAQAAYSCNPNGWISTIGTEVVAKETPQGEDTPSSTTWRPWNAGVARSSASSIPACT